MERLKVERERQQNERDQHGVELYRTRDREHYRIRLSEELKSLRAQERETGAQMDGQKVCVFFFFGSWLRGVILSRTGLWHWQRMHLI